MPSCRARILGLLVLSTLASGCGAADHRDGANGAANDARTKTVRNDGLRLDLPGWRKHRAPELGVTAAIPDRWHLADEPLTNITDPREVLALATYPLQGGGKGGGPCVATKRTLEAMPADGALIWLLEYRRRAKTRCALSHRPGKQSARPPRSIHR